MKHDRAAMVTDKVQVLSHCILYELQTGRNDAELCSNILKVFDDGTVSGSKNFK